MAKANAATGAAPPNPATVYIIFKCIHKTVMAAMFGIFNVRTNVDACDCNFPVATAAWDRVSNKAPLHNRAPQTGIPFLRHSFPSGIPFLRHSFPQAFLSLRHSFPSGIPFAQAFRSLRHSFPSQPSTGTAGPRTVLAAFQSPLSQTLGVGTFAFWCVWLGPS